MLLVALIGLALWIVVSIPAGMLFSRMATLDEQNDLEAQGEPTSDRLRAVPPPRLERDRVA
jgi:hypothetical protein